MRWERVWRKKVNLNYFRRLCGAMKYWIINFSYIFGIGRASELSEAYGILHFGGGRAD